MEFLLFIAVAIAGFIVQLKLNSVFEKYSRVEFRGGFTGAEVAERMLRANGIYDVQVTHVSGKLTDHYNPQTRTVNLSDSVYHSSSIAAAAVAAHECGHAVQHAEKYPFLQLRSMLVPVTNFASRAATWVILIGIVLASSGIMSVFWIGILLLCVSALFSIVTLPVEYNASNRALGWLERERILATEEMDGARISLKWAARTYLVAAISAITTILYYLGLARR